MTKKQIAEFTLSDGKKFLAEVDEPTDPNAFERVANVDPNQLIIKAKKTFDQVLDEIEPVASAIMTKLSKLNTPADEVEVKFGIKLNVEAGAIFASVGGEVNYEITLKWKTK
jgi:Trypsin-co-occurring domain 1